MATKTKKWVMPKWMEPYRDMIRDTGGNPIEELMNDDGTNSNVFNNAPRALICCAVKCQVAFLESLHARDLLKDVPNGVFLNPGQAEAVAEALRMGEEGLNWAKRMEDSCDVVSALSELEKCSAKKGV